MKALARDAGLADHIVIESAGTGGWHVGEAADRRSVAAARARGIELTSRACQFTAADFDRFDHVLALDRSNRRALLDLARHQDDQQKVRLLRSFDPTLSPEHARQAEVPDPYYGGPGGFDEVLEMCERACQGLIEHLHQHHGLPRARHADRHADEGR